MTRVRPTFLVIASAAAVIGSVLVACAGSPDGSEPVGSNAESLQDDLVDGPDDEYVTIPGGHRIHFSCVHEVPNGAWVNGKTRQVEVDGSVVAMFESCRYRAKLAGASDGGTDGAPPLFDASSYDEYSGADPASGVICGNSGPPFYFPYYCATWFDSLYATLTVPHDPPQHDNQLIFLWGGLVPSDGKTVLQPVLQWGHSQYSGGGNAWGFASWYVSCRYRPDCSTFDTFVSTLQNIYTGDTFHMNTYVVHDSQNGDCGLSGVNCAWQVRGWNTNGTLNSWMNVAQEPYPYNNAYATALESYGITRCDDYPTVYTPGATPDPTPFINIQAFQPGANAYDYHYLQQNWQYAVHGHFGCTYGINNRTQTTATLTY